MLKLTRKLRNKKGFSLTELIVVVAILGILAAIATPNVIRYIDDSRVSADNANAKILENTAKRLMASPESVAGTFSIQDETISDDAAVIAAIEAESGTIPACKQADQKFLLTRATGAVTVVDGPTGAVPVVPVVGTNLFLN